MASVPHPTPEVLSLVSPGSLSPLRIFISLLVLLVFLLVALFSPKSPKKGPKGARTLLLVGPLASGKTALFSKVLYGAAPPTHTSIKENEAVVKARWEEATAPVAAEKGDLKLEDDSSAAAVSHALTTPLHLVDTPGHPRLRARSLAHFLPAADGVVFTIDGQTGLSGKSVRDAAEHLHLLLSLLSLLPPSHPAPPVLILLTKSDLLSSTSSSTSSPSPAASKPKSLTLTLDRARQSLAREMERRRLASTSSSTLAGAGARLEGLEAIPASASSASLVQTILGAFGLGSKSTLGGGGGETAVVGLPEDEAEVFDKGEAFAFEGSFEWSKLEEMGVKVEWAVASVKAREGTKKWWEWVEGL
ncbi:hypothetical protein BCR35DRAFT_305124 [Leucosporidium creatinivorum]|uniref:Signal recognition particle receptor subunit beta n=1 Tax=Leucosporidium creatinivorum TaxID=106004 RepID=A0A1Y2F3M3_9BASI|nr:hypothetical protein BCR35DRAFT_305124 [Leucosporidium creatinivorum]